MKMPGHSTLVAYVSLFVALGGSAYAVSKIDSGEIANRSIKGKDVADNTLGGRQIAETKLNPPAGGGREISGHCDPQVSVATDCLTQSVKLHRPSSILVVATASKGEGAGSGLCQIAVDGAASGGRVVRGTGGEGIALTKTTSPLGAGPHLAALQCTEINPDLTIDDPTIAAVAVTTDNH